MFSLIHKQKPLKAKKKLSGTLNVWKMHTDELKDSSGQQ